MLQICEILFSIYSSWRFTIHQYMKDFKNFCKTNLKNSVYANITQWKLFLSIRKPCDSILSAFILQETLSNALLTSLVLTKMINNILHCFQKFYQLYGCLLQQYFTWKLVQKKLTVNQMEAEHQINGVYHSLPPLPYLEPNGKE